MAARTTYKLSATRTYGIEIEAYGVDKAQVAAFLNAAGIPCTIEDYNHETRATWKIVSDGSISGTNPFELVSPPLCGQDGARQIEIVCRVLNDLGVQVNHSCGLHVHHGANDLTLNDWQNLAKLYLKYEATLDTLLPVSRRAGQNQFCAALRTQFSSLDEAFRIIDRATTLEALADLLCRRVRYYTLNLMAFWRHGTVEVRHHSGTIDAAKILHWVSLTQCLILRAMERTSISRKGTDLAAICIPWSTSAARHSKPSRATAAFYANRQATFA